jgi:pimeloyl-ACP methyl ester carboxylesterase
MSIREFQVLIDGATCSGRLSQPEGSSGLKTPTVVAIHGGGYYSKYFDVPGYSLLELAETEGTAVIAIDRPGYGRSDPLPDTQHLLHQNALYLYDTIPRVVAELMPRETSIFLIGHSMGGAIAITIASLQPDWLQGIAVSGIGTVVTAEAPNVFANLPLEELITVPTDVKDTIMFGPEESIAADMPSASYVANTTIPLSELGDMSSGWVDRFSGLAGAVEVPVHYRQAEFDHIWVVTSSIVNDFARSFTRSNKVDAQIWPGVGHCIDFHKTSKEFQSQQLAFARSINASKGN